jgi:1-deoxy-D-xylulose-5-phosphate synthase
VQQHALDAGLLDTGKLRRRSLVLPDRFVEQGTPGGQYKDAGLDEAGIVAAVDRALGTGRRVAAAAAPVSAGAA